LSDALSKQKFRANGREKAQRAQKGEESASVAADFFAVFAPFRGHSGRMPRTENPMSPTDVRPLFSHETALLKVKMAEAAWNTRDPERVALAYTPDSKWRNRDEFFQGRDAIVAFLKRKWARELDYRLMKELWCFTGNRISVRFEYEWHDAAGQWYRSHGNEHWEFDDSGLMRRRDASINDIMVAEGDRRYRG
jgi:nuclear transport factor 2 (NTF2) superfamily protein